MLDDSENFFKSALKQKGIGPKGSKNLPLEVAQRVFSEFKSPQLNLTTGAALFVAFLLLDNTEEEDQLLAPFLAEPQQHLPPALQALVISDVFEGPLEEFLALVRKVARKQDLNENESNRAMELFWQSDLIPEWAKAAFLQGERIKRESFVENNVFLNAFEQQAAHVDVDFPILIDIADSYDGVNRSYHLSPFVAATLAAMGLPTILHGVEVVAPKNGVTSHQILQQLNKKTDCSLHDVKSALLDPQTQWAYVDQSVFFPQLYALRGLRSDMVKRPLIATFEKLLQPVRNRQGNTIFTCYTHSHYRSQVVELLHHNDSERTVWNMKAIEGSTNCWAKKDTPYFGYKKGAASSSQFLEGELTPSAFGIVRDDHSLVKGITSVQIAQDGFAALKGEPGMLQDVLIYQAAALSWLSGATSDPKEAAEQARAAVESGKALQHWQNYP